MRWAKKHGGQEARRELLISLCLFAIYLLNKRWKVFLGVLPHHFAANHLNDLLAGALFPSYVNLLLALSGLPFRIAGLGHILLVEAVCSFAWEVVAPHFLSGSTPDPLDACAYVAGGICYLLICRIPHSRIPSNGSPLA